MGCESTRWYFQNKNTGVKIPYRCKTGRCRRQECREAFCRKRLALVCNLVSEYALGKFFTLTLDRSLSLAQAWELIPDIWARFRKRAKREAKISKQRFDFVAVLEQHKDGYPHIHGFTNMWMHKSKWSLHWAQSGGGQHGSRIEKIYDLTNVGEYVTKELKASQYVGKDNIIGALKHVKRRGRTFWRSRGLKTKFEREKLSTGEWELVKEDGHGENYEGQDVERTQRALLKESTERRGTGMETNKTAAFREEEDSRASKEASTDQRGNQESEESIDQWLRRTFSTSCSEQFTVLKV